jgi:hypothetical protein
MTDRVKPASFRNVGIAKKKSCAWFALDNFYKKIIVVVVLFVRI